MKSKTPNLFSSSWVHMVLLTLGSLAFAYLPKWVSGFPFGQLLSSDAEKLTHGMRILYLGQTAAESGIEINTRPIGDQIVNIWIGTMSDFFGIDLLSFSVYLSILALIGFVIGIYWLCLITTESKCWSFLIAFLSIIPIHVPGGTSYGFMPWGLLARDLSLTLAIGVLILYVLGVKKNDRRFIYAAVVCCGLFTNYYAICFIHLFAMLGIVELVRLRKITPDFFAYTALWLLMASPAIWDLASKTQAWSPVDMAILRARNAFMITTSFEEAVVRYLRRFIVHVVLALTGAALILKFATPTVKARMKLWLNIAVVSFVITLVGLWIEANTEYLRTFFSRVSMYFTLASMILIAIGVDSFLRYRKWQKFSAGAVLALAGIFFLQSNFPSVYRYLAQLHATKEEKQRFFKAAELVERQTPPRSVILAPSPEADDIASSLRTYANRKIFVAYKDGGVSIVDGARARDWLDRYNRQTAVLDSGDAEKLKTFLVQEKIDFAFLPQSHPISQHLNDSLKIALVSDGYYLLEPKD